MASPRKLNPGDGAKKLRSNKVVYVSNNCADTHLVSDADHELARRVAVETGHILLEVRERLGAKGVDPKVMKDEGDLAAHNYIQSIFLAERPNDGFLSEEGANNLERLQATRTWIIDPLDGTREFSEPPRVDWAVHIALVVNQLPVVGAVALPGEDVVLATGSELTVPKAPGEKPRVIVSRTRRPAPAVQLADALNAEYIEMGSAGAKAMAVVQGQADIYAHAGGQYEWDSCAPVAVAQAAGLHCSRLDGSPMLYNNADPYLPDLLICRPEWADKSLKILAESFQAK